MTKLVFGGIAAGIALCSAIVVATSVLQAPDTVAPTARTDPQIVHSAPTPASQHVVRTGKADALDITISILRGSDTVLGDRVAPPGVPELVTLDAEPAEPPRDIITGTVETEAPVAPNPAITRQIRPAREATATRSGPTSIIPVPAPSGNRPVTAPAATTTNFSADPLDSNAALRDRQDLAR